MNEELYQQQIAALQSQVADQQTQIDTLRNSHIPLQNTIDTLREELGAKSAVIEQVRAVVQ